MAVHNEYGHVLDLAKKKMGFFGCFGGKAVKKRDAVDDADGNKIIFSKKLEDYREYFTKLEKGKYTADDLDKFAELEKDFA